MSTPSPAGAFALGLVPGMGQYYAGRPLTGTATLIGAGAALAAAIMIQDITVLCVDDPPSGQPWPEEAMVAAVTERPYLAVGVGVAAAVTIAGAIEAYLSAKRARAANAELFGPVVETGDEGLTVGLPEISGGRGRVDFSFVRYRFR